MSDSEAIGTMVRRLGSQGLLPHTHNLILWQHADGSGWGAEIDCYREDESIEVHADSLKAVLEKLMRATNRAADIPQ